MSHCDKYIEMASLYIDGELPESEVPGLLEHLDNCPECRRYYELFKDMSGALDVSPAPAGFTASVMEAVGAASGKKTTAKPRRRLVARYAALAACLALVVAAGVKFASPTGDGTANEAEPANFEYTSGEGSVTERDAEYDDYAAEPSVIVPQSVVGVAPVGSGSNCVQTADSVSIYSDGNVENYTDSETVDAIVALLRYGGQNLTAVPEENADYIVVVSGSCGTSRLNVWSSGAQLICSLDSGVSWIAIGTSEALGAIIG